MRLILTVIKKYKSLWKERTFLTRTVERLQETVCLLLFFRLCKTEELTPAPAGDAMERLERWLYWLIPFVIIARVVSLCLSLVM